MRKRSQSGDAPHRIRLSETIRVLKRAAVKAMELHSTDQGVLGSERSASVTSIDRFATSRCAIASRPEVQSDDY